MRERGHTLAEMVVVLAIVGTLAAAVLPEFRAYRAETALLGAGYVFKGEFRKARSIAIKRGAYTALRFERDGEGWSISTYVDGNGNGVLASDIERGEDRRIAGPTPLVGHAPGVRVGINPGVPAPPPERGTLDPSDPIRFGRGDILSFSPLGTATPGTFYLAGETGQAAVRVTGGSSRVRLMICRGARWFER